MRAEINIQSKAAAPLAFASQSSPPARVSPSQASPLKTVPKLLIVSLQHNLQSRPDFSNVVPIIEGVYDLGTPDIIESHGPNAHKQIYNHINRFTAAHGFGIWRASRNYSKTREIRAVMIVCGRAGKHEDTHESLKYKRFKDVVTQKCGCPFRLYASQYPPGHPKQGIWTFHVSHGLHNHGPVLASSYPTNRQLTDAQRLEVWDLAGLSVPAKAIAVRLRAEDSSCHVIPKQVDNEKSRMRLETLTSTNPTASIVD